MKNCPIPKCRVMIEDRKFLCHDHWTSLPFLLKRRVMNAFAAHLNEEISDDERDRVQNCVLQEYTAITEAPDAVRCGGGICPHCRGYVVLASVGSKYRRDSLMLDKSDEGNLVVIGGEVRPAGLPPDILGGSPYGPQFTRFEVHRCTESLVAAAITNGD